MLMSIEELEEALEEILPNGYRLSTDKSGRVVIHTNLFEDENGDLVPAEEDDDEDQSDLDDPDFEQLEDEDEDE